MDVLTIDISETIDQTAGGFWFDFEPSLLQQDENDPNTQTMGDLSGEPRGICKFYLKGSCSKGPGCQFRHARGERSIVCKHWLRALCKKGDACEFLHRWDLSRMPECYFFSKFGECSNPECMYLHINPEDKVKECPWYARGFCRHGEKCRHKHIRKVLCDNYFLGFCPLGPNCKFGHPHEAKELESLMETSQRKTTVVCHKCGVAGHKAGSCPNFPHDGEKRPLEAVTCYKCGQLGHYANKCNNSSNNQGYGGGGGGGGGGGSGGGGGGMKNEPMDQDQYYPDQEFQGGWNQNSQVDPYGRQNRGNW